MIYYVFLSFTLYCREIDPGCSKMTGKYLLIYAEAQEKVLALRKSEEESLSLKEMKVAISDIVKSKIIANKMLSSNFIRT